MFRIDDFKITYDEEHKQKMLEIFITIFFVKKIVVCIVPVK